MLRANEPATGQTFEHRTFRDDEFWRDIPVWSDIAREKFGDPLWQARKSVTSLKQLKETLQDRLCDDLVADIEAGLHIAPMNIRITPYVFSLIDWNNPVDDPCGSSFCRWVHRCCPTTRSILRIRSAKTRTRRFRCSRIGIPIKCFFTSDNVPRVLCVLHAKSNHWRLN